MHKLFHKMAFAHYAKLVRQMLSLAWKSHPISFLVILMLPVIQGIVPPAIAWVAKSLFDLLTQSHVELSGKNVNLQLAFLLILYIILGSLLQILGDANKYANDEFGRALRVQVLTNIYSHVNSMEGIDNFEKPETRDLIDLATQGAQYGPARMINICASLLQSIITLASFLSILLLISPLLALMIFVASFPAAIVHLKMGKQRFVLATSINIMERRAGYLGQLLTSLSFVKEIKVFRLGNNLLQRYLKITREISQSQRKQQLMEIRWSTWLNFLAGFVGLIGLATAFIEAFSGQITVGDVTLYITAIRSAQFSLSIIIISITSSEESLLFFSHYTKLLDIPTRLPSLSNEQPMHDLETEIELRNVSFRYSENHPWIFKGLNLIIPKGKCLALVGLNGTGKTTLVKLLTRLYDPTEGGIYWDGIDIRAFEVSKLRQHVSALFQDFVHYELTLAENIGFGEIDSIDDNFKIHQAAKTAGVDFFVDNLPKGYSTVLSRWLVDKNEIGIDLSGGQWQKVALARLYMSITNANLLILDEPTSSLDINSENLVYEQLMELNIDKTIILISHRFSAVKVADVIAVLENGRIVECGTHAELIEAKGSYEKIYKMQVEHS